MTVYENIQNIAKEHGLTIKEIAIKAGIGENSIYRWQKSTPSITSLNKIARALHVDVEDLTSDNKDETPEFRAIQRKAKNLNHKDQEKLLNIINAAFGDKDSEH